MPIVGFHTADGENLPPQVLQKGGPVKRYDVVINGVETTLQLTDEDAKARGLKPQAEVVESKQAKPPANKARTTAAVEGDA